MVKRVGIVGYGNLGKFLVSKIFNDDEYKLVFVWNRSKDKLKDVDCELVLNNLEDFSAKTPDLVVEVSHPSITKVYGKVFLKYCDYMIGSPTALSDGNLFNELSEAATEHGLYIPSGAFWGGEDIRKMSDAGVLKALSVTMKKHPLSLKLEGYLKEKNVKVKEEPVILYHGCVRDVCALAPHNTNTMAAAAIAAPSLGFDGVIGCLVADPRM